MSLEVGVRAYSDENCIVPGGEVTILWVTPLANLVSIKPYFLFTCLFLCSLMDENPPNWTQLSVYVSISLPV